MNIRVPYRLTQRLAERVQRQHHRVASQSLSRLYGANTVEQPYLTGPN